MRTVTYTAQVVSRDRMRHWARLGPVQVRLTLTDSGRVIAEHTKLNRGDWYRSRSAVRAVWDLKE